LEEDKVTPEHLSIAFKTLAGEKDFVTEQDFYRGGLSLQLVEQLKSQLQPKDDGYDYAAFIDHIFVK
jgi:hypothetical protein